VKNNQDNQIRTITLCNVYFSKKVYAVYNVYHGVWGKAPETGEFSKKICVKSNLTVCKVTFSCKLQKKNAGAGCTSCSPNSFVGKPVSRFPRLWPQLFGPGGDGPCDWSGLRRARCLSATSGVCTSNNNILSDLFADKLVKNMAVNDVVKTVFCLTVLSLISRGN